MDCTELYLPSHALKAKFKSTKRLVQCHLIFIIIKYIYFLIRPLLEARAEIQKYFRSFFGSNENFEICFRDLLTSIGIGREKRLLKLNYYT